MPSLSAGIYIALQSVLSHSHAMEVIEHNVANANTVGYRRQSAVLSATAPSQSYGSGVTVDAIKRFNLEFFDGRYRGINADAKKWEMQRDVMVQLESTLAETGSDGVLAHLDQFWSGWEQVASDPTNTSLRAAVLDDANTLANALNRRAVQLNLLNADQDLAINSRVEEINDLASRVAETNGEISRVLSLGEQPNDLLDKRDAMLDRLSETAGATSYMQKNGEVIVSIGGHVLVTGSDTMKLSYGLVPDVGNPDPTAKVMAITWDNGAHLSAPSGEIRGLLDGQGIIKQQQVAQDEMADALITSINDIHDDGYGMNDNVHRVFFAGTNAMTIGVNPALTSQDLAVASNTGEAANNVIATRIAALRTSKIMDSGTQTIHQYYNGKVTQLGMDLGRAKDSVTHLGSISTTLGLQRESVIGVNLDEEAANMVRSQKAYQAAARMMNVFDELLDTIINGMGLAGR